MGNMITKQEFINGVKNAVILISGRTVDAEVSSYMMNNGIESNRLIVNYPGRAGISVYMDDLYQAFCKRDEDVSTVNDCAETILRMLRENIGQADWLQEEIQDRITDYEKVKPMLRLCLVNGRLNQKKLATHPHIPFLDLEIIFYVEIEKREESIGSVAVDNNLLGLWGISLEQMYQDALANMQAEEPAAFRTMQDIPGLPLDDIMAGAGITVPDIYILSNKSCINGAVSILYPEILEKCAETVRGDFWLVPSSVHEFLVCPAAVITDKNELKEMICQVNEKELKPEEILSNHPYFYSVKGKIISM